MRENVQRALSVQARRIKSKRLLLCRFPACLLIIRERGKSVVCTRLLWNACSVPQGRWEGVVFLKRGAGDFSDFTVNCILGVSSASLLVWVNPAPFLSLKE